MADDPNFAIEKDEVAKTTAASPEVKTTEPSEPSPKAKPGRLPWRRIVWATRHRHELKDATITFNNECNVELKKQREAARVQLKADLAAQLGSAAAHDYLEQIQEAEADVTVWNRRTRKRRLLVAVVGVVLAVAWSLSWVSLWLAVTSAVSLYAVAYCLAKVGRRDEQRKRVLAAAFEAYRAAWAVGSQVTRRKPERGPNGVVVFPDQPGCVAARYRWLESQLLRYRPVASTTAYAAQVRLAAAGIAAGLGVLEAHSRDTRPTPEPAAPIGGPMSAAPNGSANFATADALSAPPASGSDGAQVAFARRESHFDAVAHRELLAGLLARMR